MAQSPPLIVASRPITPGFNGASERRFSWACSTAWPHSISPTRTSPQFIQTIAGGYTTDLKTAGSLLYRLKQSGVVEVWNASNPASLQILANYPIQAGGQGTLSIQGSRLAAVLGGEVKLFTVGVAGLLTEQSAFTPAGDARAVALRDTAMYVLPTDGNLLVYDVSNLTNPVLQPPIVIGVPPIANGFGGELEALGDRLHVLSARRGYVLLDITNRLGPSILGSFDESLLEAQGLAVAGSTVYLATTGWCGKWGVRALDISSPAQITEITAVDATYFTHDVLAFGSVVYVTESDGGLRVRTGVASRAAGSWNRYK